MWKVTFHTFKIYTPHLVLGRINHMDRSNSSILRKTKNKNVKDKIHQQVQKVNNATTIKQRIKIHNL